MTILKMLLFSFTCGCQGDEAELEKILQELIDQNEELEVFCHLKGTIYCY